MQNLSRRSVAKAELVAPEGIRRAQSGRLA
jgi:hypothetical protein